LNAIPLSQQQIDYFHEKADETSANKFWFVKTVIIEDNGVIDDDGSTIKFSDMTNEEKEELCGGFIVDGFDIQYVSEKCILFRKLGLIWLENGFFELLESTKSADFIKYRDQRGNEYVLKFVPQNEKKKKKEGKRAFKPPKTEGGKDALDSLHR